MKLTAFSIFLFFIQHVAFAQDFKPLLDPTNACSYANPIKPEGYKTGYFFIVEEMPRPKKTLSSIEKLLQKKVTHQDIPTGPIVFQTLINCEGKASDYQLLSCNSETAFVCKQVLEIFQKEIEWDAGKQKNRNVDVLMKVSIKFEEGQFRVILT